MVVVPPPDSHIRLVKEVNSFCKDSLFFVKRSIHRYEVRISSLVKKAEEAGLFAMRWRHI